MIKKTILFIILTLATVLLPDNTLLANKEIQSAFIDQKENVYHLVIATGYSNNEISINVPKWFDGKTASNTPVRRGICAADWNVFSPGTRLFVPGYGECVVEDKGGAIKGKRLDLFFDTHEEALEWGRRHIQIEILK